MATLSLISALSTNTNKPMEPDCHKTVASRPDSEAHAEIFAVKTVAMKQEGNLAAPNAGVTAEGNLAAALRFALVKLNRMEPLHLTTVRKYQALQQVTRDLQPIVLQNSVNSASGSIKGNTHLHDGQEHD
jgi:hypothetical protein